MPIYEFYCPVCHAIYSFLSLQVNTDKHPPCPDCGRPNLKRQASSFAVSKKRSEESSDAGFDESKMEQALAHLAGDLDGMNGEDPKAAAKLLRKLTDAAGMRMGSGMEEALRRMEAGEDPEAIEAELGDALENENPFDAAKAQGATRKRAPRRDETIYDL